MGVRKNVNILLIDALNTGDSVLVHAGFAIGKIEEEYYDFLTQALDEMLDEQHD